jgi:hypothetical protein
VDPRLKPARSANPLRRWQRRTLSAAAWALLLTGLAWFPVHYLWGAGAGELPSPAEPWLMRVHGLGVLVGLFALGVAAADHVPRGWRMGLQRASGAALCAAWALLAASGWALSYATPEAWRPWVGGAHAALGAAAFAIGVAHARRSC